MLRSGAGADDVVESSWVHFKAMQFIKDKINKASTGNLTLLMPSKQSAANASKVGPKSNPSKQNEPKTEKRKSLETAPIISAMTLDESDWHYFLSLMPYLSFIDGRRNKWKFRMEALHLLFKFLEKQEEKEIEVKQEMDEAMYISDDDGNKYLLKFKRHKNTS